MDKLYRRTQILDLIRAEPIATQAELCQKLARRDISEGLQADQGSRALEGGLRAGSQRDEDPIHKESTKGEHRFQIAEVCKNQ